MSKDRISKKAGWAGALPTGPGGRSLCRQCGEEVPKGRRTFCGDECVDRWKIKTDPGYVRMKVYERDQGVCAVCHIATDQVERMFGTLRDLAQGHYGEGARPGFPELQGFVVKIQRILKIWSRSTYWDADHIKGVAEGGGECSLKGYQTLCIWCHKAKSAKARRKV